jgi:hypothetical protein
MADAEVEKAPEGNAAAESPALAAIDRLGEVAKWLVAAFAAIGTSLVAGSQLSEIGELEGLRLFWAFLGIASALLGVALAIWVTVKVLMPQHASLARLARDEEKSAAGELVKEDPDLLMGHGKKISELEASHDRALKAESEAWDQYDANPTDETRAAVDRAVAERKRIDDAVQTFLPIALYAEVRDKFRAALAAMFAGALLAAAGIALFAWAAHPEEEKSEPSAEPAAAKIPIEVELSLSDDGKNALGSRIGRACDTGRVRALAIGGEPAALDVVTMPTAKCSTVHFTLTDELGTAVGVDKVAPLPPCPRDNPKPPCVIR